jgi:hypothetical protein
MIEQARTGVFIGLLLQTRSAPAKAAVKFLDTGYVFLSSYRKEGAKVRSSASRSLSTVPFSTYSGHPGEMFEFGRFLPVCFPRLAPGSGHLFSVVLP